MKKKLKRSLKKLILSLKPRQKVAMLHPGRCGSTVLGKLINQHPQMYWSGEPFLRHYSDQSLALKQIEAILQQAELGRISSVYSFATKYPRGMDLSSECVDMSIGEYVDLLKSWGYRKFVFLERQNYLKRVISTEKGRQTGVWHSDKLKSGVDLSAAIELDPLHFQTGEKQYLSLQAYFAQLDREREEIYDAVGGAPLLYLSYERDIEADPRKAYRKFCEFTGQKEQQAEVSIKKTNTATIAEALENFEAVANHLQGTAYAWMLKD